MRAPALLLALALTSGAVAGQEFARDVAAARALFEANLAAIAQRDRDAYLACYLESDRLARTGPDGFLLGYEGLAEGAGDGWPEVFEAQEMRFVPLAPGLVYGTYRYRVRFDGDEQTGLSERLFVDTPDGWRIAVTTAFPAPPGTAAPARALVGATLVAGTGAAPLVDAVVVMRDGLIECAGSRDDCPVPDGVAEVDVAGSWITPGLIDTHVHFSQTGWADGRPDFIDVRERHPYADVIAERRRSPETYHRAFLCSGVTAVFDVGGYPWTWELDGAVEGDSSEAPHVAASGPLLTTLDHWINLPGEKQLVYIADEQEARDGVAYLAAGGADAAKIWFINHDGRPFEEMEAVVTAAGDEARQRELPMIVHATGLQEAKVAVRAGADLLVHSVWDREVDDEFVQLLKERGTIYCPTLTVAAGYQRLAAAVLAGRAPKVDDPNGCVDAETLARVASSAELGAGELTAEALERRAARTAERERISALNLARLAEAGVSIAMGTDAGNPMTLHGPSVYAELEAMQAAGMTPMAVLVAATATAARAMGRQNDLGTVEAGKIADLLVLGADPTADVAAFRQLTHVVRAGVLRPVEELSARP